MATTQAPDEFCSRSLAATGGDISGALCVAGHELATGGRVARVLGVNLLFMESSVTPDTDISAHAVLSDLCVMVGGMLGDRPEVRFVNGQVHTEPGVPMLWLPQHSQVIAKIPARKGNYRWFHYTVGIRSPRLKDGRWTLPQLFDQVGDRCDRSVRLRCGLPGHVEVVAVHPRMSGGDRHRLLLSGRRPRG